MSADEKRELQAPKDQPVFATTRWSEVLAARQAGPAHSHEALARLCETYWYPLYAFLRRRGLSPEDAQDSTQEFFARLLAGGWLQEADRAKGRFRTFLLTALTRFMANEWDRARAQKRGGGQMAVPLDTQVAESRYQSHTQLSMSPDSLYDRQWAMTLLERALGRLEAAQNQLGKNAEFAVLSPALTLERGETPYARLAEQLSVSEAAARMAVHRLRKQFRQVFREEIAQTVADPTEVEAEIRHLIAALAGDSEQQK